MPLTAEGEFALVNEYLKVISNTPALRRGSLITDNVLNFMAADLAVLARNETDLYKYAEIAATTAERDDHILFQASAQRALGVLHRLTGDFAEAETYLQRALRAFADMETKWQLGRTLTELGEVAIARTDYAEARNLYARAIVAFDKMGANPDLERARAALTALQRDSSDGGAK